MAQGLQCWDQYGRLIFDTGDRFGRTLGSLYTGAASGSAYVAEFSQGQGFAVCCPTSSDGVGPQVWVDGNILYWQYNNDPAYTDRVNALIIYGVF